jgi:hypothetical protein
MFKSSGACRPFEIGSLLIQTTEKEKGASLRKRLLFFEDVF